MFQKLFVVGAAALLVSACGDVARPTADGPVGPPPGERAFTISFDTGSAALSKTSEGTLDKAASSYRVGGITKVTLVGHADTVGTPDSNMTLSQRRASAVQTGLMARGVPMEIMTVTADGEEKLVVKTADDVSEAKNRVVTIRLR